MERSRLNAEANHTLRRIREFAVREELNMGDELGDSGTLSTTVPDLLQRALQKFGELSFIVTLSGLNNLYIPGLD